MEKAQVKKRKPKRNYGDVVFGGVRAPLEGVDRSKPTGFKKYYSQRQDHFKELFGVEYSEDSAMNVFKVLNKPTIWRKKDTLNWRK